MVPRLLFAALVLVSLGSRPPVPRRTAATEARPAAAAAVTTAAPATSPGAR